ncbi:MAG: BrxE family protein [Kiritimatiellales bacterium]
MNRNINQAIVNYAVLQLTVGYLGEKHQSGWWDSNFLSGIGQQMLGMTFPRSALSAGCTSVKEAARRLHDSRIGVGGVFHLFRLPPDIEERVHHYILNADPAELGSCIASKEAALNRLGSLAGAAKSTAAEGPSRISSEDVILTKTTIEKTAQCYLAAFTKNRQIFPYFQGHS